MTAVDLQGNKCSETQDGRRSVTEHKVMGKRVGTGCTEGISCPAVSSCVYLRSFPANALLGGVWDGPLSFLEENWYCHHFQNLSLT